MAETTSDQGLERSMGLTGLIFYGIGTILGAGIFVVIGEVIAKAGVLSPLAYVIGATVAVTSAMTFSEIGARIPSAGGAVEYMEQSFGRGLFATTVGWVLVAANIVSGATITTGFVSYLGAFVDLPGWIATVGLVALLVAIAAIGMKQSAWFMTTTTIVGLGTLVLIVWINREGLMASPGAMLGAFGGEGTGDGTGGLGAGLFAAAFLSVYSFIGFGDVAQTAEEVKDVRKTLPRAMMIVLGVVLVSYVVIAMAVTGSGDTEALAEAEAPLVRAVERHGWPGLPFAIASLFVIVNGGLTQIIAAARLLLELARDGNRAPAIFARVNDATDTPLMATLASGAVVLALAMFVPLGTLAQGTSLAILVVFAAVNAALWRLKRQGQPEGVPDVWIGWPVLGMAVCGAAVLGQVGLWLFGPSLGAS
ncbi:APC family permease [Jannaschia formosa]|uniref:APC family permease n=1 Tax=Jannaschia formosa TaxID=2259592 RepID=UPI000E1C31A2|nr:amino acid permease [Jannaschia formosa]TFL19066.1 amino acid permease [Jannaschia formosa]